MLSLLIDFETTGIDTSQARIIEIGAQVVDKDWEVISSLSCLVKGEDYPLLTDDIQRITKITQQELDSRGLPVVDAYDLLADLCIPEVQYSIAYNKSFDEILFKTEMARTGLSMKPGINMLMQLPWLCAMVDIETNYKFKSWKLMHMALEYGVAVDPKQLHRAINDVELMRQMLKATGIRPLDMYMFQQSPWTFVRALIPAPWEDGGAGKKQAQDRGYNWETAKGTDGPKFEKAWVKRIKSTQLQQEVADAPFKVREIKLG
jgi:DNA polymerase III epsilon subunit-like protein